MAAVACEFGSPPISSLFPEPTKTINPANIIITIIAAFISRCIPQTLRLRNMLKCFRDILALVCLEWFLLASVGHELGARLRFFRQRRFPALAPRHGQMRDGEGGRARDA